MAAARERAAHMGSGSGEGFAPEAQILPRAVVLRVRRVRHGMPRRLHAKGGDAIDTRRWGGTFSDGRHSTAMSDTAW